MIPSVIPSASAAGALAPLQTVAFDDLTVLQSLDLLLAFTVAAGGTSAIAALVFRWYTREPVPLGVSTLLGLSVVALYLNAVGLFSTVGLFTQIIGGGSSGIFELDAVVFNVVAIGLAVFVTPVGRRVGDRIATDVFAVAGARELDAEVSRLVRTVGRVTAVTLPEAEEINDMESYDPVAAELKAEMGGKTLLFPNRLTVEELRDRLVTRLKDDYRVGYVDVEITDRGVVEYLALGSRVAGLGPTLGHGTVAVPIRADPPQAAGPGDLVQVWRPAVVEAEPPGDDPGVDDSGGDGDRAKSSTGEGTRRPPQRLFTAELRATSGDVVTLAVDAADAERVDATTTYRLVSLPAEPRVDREFASLLRVADETMAAVTVPEGSEVVGETLGSLDVTVVAMRPADGPIRAIPTRSRVIEPADTLYVVARPEVLRRLEARTNVVVEVSPAAAEAMEAAAD